MLSRIVSCVFALMLLVAAAPAAAQWVNPDTCSMADFSCQQARKERDDKRASDAQSQQIRDEREQRLRALLKAPALPAERNVLLGTWRLDGGGQRSDGSDLGLLKEFLSNPFQLMCALSFGSGITFAPSTYSIRGLPQALGGPIAYRGGGKQAIAAIVIDRQVQSMLFDIASPNRIVSELGGCALVRVGAPAANAAVNATTAPGNARTAPASGGPGAVVDGAAFRCADGSLLHVSLCQGDAAEANCKLAELHLPGLQMGKMARRTDIAARVMGCEAGGIRYGADDKPVFVH